MKQILPPGLIPGGSLGAVAVVASLFFAATSSAHPRRRETTNADQPRQVISEKTGSLGTHAGLAMRLVTDWGDIVIHTHDAPRVDYRVRMETASAETADPDLARSFEVLARNTPAGVFLRGQRTRSDFGKTERVWVTFDVTVPRDFSVEVSTRCGNVQAPDLQGRITLVTSGGNIFLGNVRGSVRLQTAGGHISVKDVSGDLDAETGGGHITTGKVAGSATLKTGGGHIRAAGIAREARLETAGGNISLGSSGGPLVVATGGGQIDIGEASGAIRARTGGGGIRVVSSKGPTQLDSESGSIYLSRVISPVHAQTASGGITAWLGAAGDHSTPCDLESGDGDIVVYLPSNLAVTIDVTVQAGSLRHIYVDPMLPVKISREITSGNSGVVRTEAALNGGGELLRLKTIEGNIRLLLSDQARESVLYKQQMDEIERQVQQQVQQQLKQPAARNKDSGNSP
jgi:DUF4097 and DUF4098 domain-containing protein YvlB